MGDVTIARYPSSCSPKRVHHTSKPHRTLSHVWRRRRWSGGDKMGVRGRGLRCFFEFLDPLARFLGVVCPFWSLLGSGTSNIRSVAARCAIFTSFRHNPRRWSSFHGRCFNYLLLSFWAPGPVKSDPVRFFACSKRVQKPGARAGSTSRTTFYGGPAESHSPTTYTRRKNRKTGAARAHRTRHPCRCFGSEDSLCSQFG